MNPGLYFIQQKAKEWLPAPVQHIYFTIEDLDKWCDEVSQGRPFDPIVNNCQHYCSQIRKYLLK